jgi:hypothetical protein
MFIDIVIPHNNEQAFIKMAERLGIGLCFLYKEKPKSGSFSGTYKKVGGVFTATINDVSVVFDAETPEQLPNEGFVGISLSSMRLPSKMKYAARTIKICRKRNLKLVAASLAKTPYDLPFQQDLLSLIVCMGATPGEAKKATLSSAEILRNI